MKKIYIVISYTGTSISKIIKMYTKHTYTHVSIALDRELEELYSFARLYKYSVFPAGFVHEGIDVGTFKRFEETKAAVFSKEVTEQQYKKIQYVIKQMEKEKSKYKYNFLGLIAMPLGKKIARENHFYCTEFVKYVLGKRRGRCFQAARTVKTARFCQLRKHGNDI